MWETENEGQCNIYRSHEESDRWIFNYYFAVGRRHSLDFSQKSQDHQKKTKGTRFLLDFWLTVAK